MDFDELKKKMDELEKELRKDPPNYMFFRTEAGKKFENQFDGLMSFANASNILSILPMLYSFASGFLNNVQIETLVELQDSVDENGELSEEAQKEAKEIFKQELTKLTRTFKINQKLKETVSSFMDRINSYIFLAFYAYLDVYIKALFEFLESKIELVEFEKLKTKFESKKEKNVQINVIKNFLKLITKDELGSILKRRTWKESFDMLLERRHFMAHEEPLARYQMLTEKFKKVVKKAVKKIKELPKQLRIKVSDFKRFSKLFDEMKINILILFTLLEIGKDCYSYLALIDILVDNHFNSEVI